jgi:hypothetical protein
VFLTGSASSKARGVAAVPAAALVYGREGASVFVLRNDNSVTKVKVTIGSREGSLVELISGPPPGAMVVTAGSAFLAEGEQINPIKGGLKSSAPAQPAPPPKK